jgi:hypothetical protein
MVDPSELEILICEVVIGEESQKVICEIEGRRILGHKLMHGITKQDKEGLEGLVGEAGDVIIEVIRFQEVVPIVKPFLVDQDSKTFGGSVIGLQEYLCKGGKYTRWS